MNDAEYIKRMTALTDELNNAASAEPYDPVAYNRVIDEFNKIQPPWESRPCRPSWIMIAIISFLLFILGFIVWWVIRPF